MTLNSKRAHMQGISNQQHIGHEPSIHFIFFLLLYILEAYHSHGTEHQRRFSNHHHGSRVTNCRVQHNRRGVEWTVLQKWTC